MYLLDSLVLYKFSEEFIGRIAFKEVYGMTMATEVSSNSAEVQSDHNKVQLVLCTSMKLFKL